MAPRHRLCRLQMREPGHHPVRAGFGLLDKRPLQRPDAGNCRIALVPHPKPKIGRDLVIPAPRGMKPSRRRTDQLVQARLDVHVDVFKRGLKPELAGVNL